MDNTIYNEYIKVKTTEEILLSISKHLSSKSKCKGVEYRVAIGVKDYEQLICRKWRLGYENYIFFDIDVEIFPNRYNRKQYQKSPVIQHVIINHFYDIFAGCAMGNIVQIKPNTLVPGIYQYTKSKSSGKRKWSKLV